MRIALELTFEVENQIRENIAKGDIDSIYRLLTEALVPNVEALIHEFNSELTEAEFEVIADQIADKLIEFAGPLPDPLSNYAVSRKSIYADHL